MTFWNDHKIGKPLASNQGRKKKDTNKIINERGEITTGMTKWQRIIGNDYYQLNANKLDNLEEVGKFLGHKPKRLNN